MPKNAVQRLQKIENELKTVISIYEVSKKCNNIHEKLEIGDEFVSQDEVCEPRTELDFSNSVTAPPSQGLNELKNCPRSARFSVLPTIYEVSNAITRQTESDEKQVPVHDTDGTYENFSGTTAELSITVENNKTNLKKSKEEKENRNAIFSKNRIVSTGKSPPLKEYPDWLIKETSNWFGSLKHTLNKSDVSMTPVGVKKVRSPEEKNTGNGPSRIRNSKNKKDVSDTKPNQNIQTGKGKSNKSVVQKESVSNHQVNSPAVLKTARNEQTWTKELPKMIEKSNEKLEKMKVSKELALDIAKHLKKRYDEIHQSKQELMEELLQVQKDNERLKIELKEEQFKTGELKEKQIEQDIKAKKTTKEVEALKGRITELEKELLERQRDIDKIQTKRLGEIRNELESKENQAKDIQRLSNEKCQLLARTEELAVLLTDRNLEKQYLMQKVRQLEEEVQTQRQHIKKKTKALEERTTELESIRQKPLDLEQEIAMLRKNSEETQKDLQKRTEDYEQQLKSSQEEVLKLQEENMKLKNELGNEKDALLIKAKIIEDQQETIKQLKEKSEEVKSLLKQKESLERILNTEREEKLELEEAVECLKMRKEELKRKIKVLESAVIVDPQEVAEDLQKTQAIIYELENQFRNKQKEWELQLQSVIREKKQACSIAEYATKKLIQTSSKFQKRSEAHVRLRRILNENLA